MQLLAVAADLVYLFIFATIDTTMYPPVCEICFDTCLYPLQ